MIVYVPTDENPLLGRLVEVNRPPRAKPAAIRAIWRARTAAKRRYGYPEPDCREWAAQDVAKMLGVDVAMVRRFCRMEGGRRDTATATATQKKRLDTGGATVDNSLHENGNNDDGDAA